MVMRTSHPKPEASGKQAARARGLTSRWPESGSRGATPVRSQHQPPGDALGEPEAPSHPPAEGRDRKVGRASAEREERAPEVGVGQQQRPRRRRPFAGRERLALAEPLEAENRSSGRLCARGRLVVGAPVDDDHLRSWKVPSEGDDGLRDPLLLVARRNEDGEPFGPGATHPRSVTGSIGGMTPSVAVSRRP